MTKKLIMNAAHTAKAKFLQTIIGEQYQIRGIFNSEALVIVAFAEHFNVSHIIESGRARGHSTNLLAKYFIDTDVKITSIDFDANSEDSKYSEKILNKYPNVNVIYGDSNKLLVDSINEDCIVFIDGPKGDEAITLAVAALKDKRVKAVCLHDFHKDDFLREVCEAIFTDYFFTDDLDFIEQFKDLDTDCWKVLDGKGYAPYVKYDKPSSSYAATMGVFLNSEHPFVEPALSNYQAFKHRNRPTLAKWFVATVPHDSWLYKIAHKLYSIFKK